MIQFVVISRNGSVPTEGQSTAFLQIDHWNDYSFVTMFQVTVFDENAERHDLGNVKIGFQGQDEKTATFSRLSGGFVALPREYFSVGIDVDYYLVLSRRMSDEFRSEYLTALRDIAHDQKILELALDERVFQTSHLRSLNINTVVDQFRRVLEGGVPLTDYKFRFTQDEHDHLAGYQLEFDVKARAVST